MAKAIFHRAFHWSRPNSPLGFGASQSQSPQKFPRDFVAAAVAAGAATEVPHGPNARNMTTEPAPKET